MDPKREAENRAITKGRKMRRQEGYRAAVGWDRRKCESISQQREHGTGRSGWEDRDSRWALTSAAQSHCSSALLAKKNHFGMGSSAFSLSAPCLCPACRSPALSVITEGMDEAMGNPRVGAEGGVEQPGQKALQNHTTDLKENPGTAQ